MPSDKAPPRPAIAILLRAKGGSPSSSEEEHPKREEKDGAGLVDLMKEFEGAKSAESKAKALKAFIRWTMRD